MSSAGQIAVKRKPPYFILIEKALRDEGTSYHYLPPSDYSSISAELHNIMKDALSQFSWPIYRGVTWTTDAPFRETASSILVFGIYALVANSNI
jgi:uridine phosphorylase